MLGPLWMPCVVRCTQLTAISLCHNKVSLSRTDLWNTVDGKYHQNLVWLIHNFHILTCWLYATLFSIQTNKQINKQTNISITCKLKIPWLSLAGWLAQTLQRLYAALFSIQFYNRKLFHYQKAGAYGKWVLDDIQSLWPDIYEIKYWQHVSNSIYPTGF